MARKNALDNRQRTAVKEAGMGMKSIIVWLVSLALASIHLAEAQQVGKIPRIGFLFEADSSEASTRIEAFRQGLRQLGYIEGKIRMINFSIDSHVLTLLSIYCLDC